MDIPAILTLQVINLGPVFDPLYKVGSAQFTTVPEPNSVAPLAFAAALLMRKRHLRVCQVFTPLFFAAALADSLAAGPIPTYMATSAWFTYTANSTLTESFSFN